MSKNVSSGRVIPVVLFGALLIVAASVIYIGLMTPKDTTPHETLAKSTISTSTPTPTEKPQQLYLYSSDVFGVSFKFPSNLDVVEETRKRFSLGTNGSEDIILTTFESVPIRKLRLCEYDSTVACIFDGYGDQEYLFNSFKLDDKKAKSFYYQDTDGQVWHIVSLSEYQEFQLMAKVGYDPNFQTILDTFDFFDNN